jgi:hypothetical protein
MPYRPVETNRSEHFGRREDRSRQYGGAREFSGRKVRQGRIVLNTPLRRAVFVGGLVIAVLAAFILGYLA